MKERKLKHDYENIYKRHFNGESILNISRDLGIHIQSIYAYFQRNKLKYNTNIQSRKEGYIVNDNYLDDIDTENNAYFLGWMLSDGCVTGNRIKLKLKLDDEYIITEMFSKFSDGYKINSDKNSKHMEVSSDRLAQNLKKLGCVENKTKIGFGLPDIPDELFKHFVRAYFEGDGSIWFKTNKINKCQVNICSPDKFFLEQLKDKLLEYGIITTIYTEVRKGKSLKRPSGEYSTDNVNIHRIIFTTHTSKLKFYELIYTDCSIKLMRKYDLYTRYYNNTVSLLESKNSKAVQHIDDKIIINYDLINDKTFQLGNEVDDDLVLKLYKQGINKFSIHKETKIGRSVIERIIKNFLKQNEKSNV